ncbi:MAG TPA: SigE family RNA polymerase sigma factor [Streptosporangiaceae bacterium]|nr:SigE family RNA polymerase sigma factor [Streptosporangiaceae bacterium]
MAREDEFAEFVAGALPGLLRLGYALTGDRHAAEDLVQTALGRSLLAWRLHHIDDPRAFVRKVMVNSYASWYRRHAGREWVTADPVDHSFVEDHAGRSDDRDAVWRALRVLPARQRAVVVLRYFEDLSEAQTAAVMGTSTGTVKSQSARALKRLAGLLAPAEVSCQVRQGSST